jgi:hypothetical protein
MKKALAILGQFLLFYLVFFVGSLLAAVDPLKLRWFVSHPTLTSTRWFSPEGLILVVLLFVAMMGIHAARRRLRASGPVTAIAFAIALLLGVLSKFGWATHDLF